MGDGDFRLVAVPSCWKQWSVVGVHYKKHQLVEEEELQSVGASVDKMYSV